ncbi:MT-A70 family methyltransferase [Sulfitobacter sp. 1A15106]|uniref:MT-A70 family methyltransferase n=1 Tax=Sulfitobacter sp. 1A15106 TaxID=3368590 RepID=UPI003745209E
MMKLDQWQGIPFPTVEGGYQVILADPPWKFKTFTKEGSAKGPDVHYGCMPLEEIQAMPVKELAAKNCVVLMWATSPMLPEGLETMRAWGAKYVSSMAWDKRKIGTGYWTRNQHELLLIGKFGSPRAPTPEHRRASVIYAPGMRHSQKPDDAHIYADNAWPEARKLELFARRPYPGWNVWGNEVEVGYCAKYPGDQIDLEDAINGIRTA